MGQNVCAQCGAPIEPGAVECKFCGEKVAVQQTVQQGVQQQQVVQQPEQQVMGAAQPQQPYMNFQQNVSGISPSWPIKSKVAAGLLAIFLGAFGIHKFYLGKTGMGILYLIFCWTYIPAIIGFVEGIIYLCSNDENFQLKHHVRIK